MEKPKVRNDITLQDLGDEIMLYDTDGEKVHVLNHTAGIIWNLCDGQHSIDQMQQELLQKYPEMFITPDLRVECEGKRRKEMLHRLEERFGEYTDPRCTDGIRLVFQSGWALVRESVTEPMITMRFEGDSEQSLRQVTDRILSTIPELAEEAKGQLSPRTILS